MRAILNEIFYRLNIGANLASEGGEQCNDLRHCDEIVWEIYEIHWDGDEIVWDIYEIHWEIYEIVWEIYEIQ